jgi:hypothetical protein
VIEQDRRRWAASLIRRFRDGELTNDELVEDWPASRGDEALAAIERALWFFYSDNRPHKLTDLSADGYQALSRMAAFLDTELPYEWPQANPYRLSGLGLLNVLSLGLLDRWIRRSKAEFEAKLRASGDPDVWPFIRRSDLPAEPTDPK